MKIRSKKQAMRLVKVVRAFDKFRLNLWRTWHHKDIEYDDIEYIEFEEELCRFANKYLMKKYYQAYYDLYHKLDKKKEFTVEEIKNDKSEY